jgi:hypothetical protein
MDRKGSVMIVIARQTNATAKPKGRRANEIPRARGESGKGGPL